VSPPARAAPEGYTWRLGMMGNLTGNQHLYPKVIKQAGIRAQ
jgi:hypothetical protein